MVSRTVPNRPPSPLQQREQGLGVSGRYSALQGTAQPRGLGFATTPVPEVGKDWQQRLNQAADLPNGGAPPPFRGVAGYGQRYGQPEAVDPRRLRAERSVDRAFSPQPRSVGSLGEPRSPDGRNDATMRTNVYLASAPAAAPVRHQSAHSFEAVPGASNEVSMGSSAPAAAVPAAAGPLAAPPAAAALAAVVTAPTIAPTTPAAASPTPTAAGSLTAATPPAAGSALSRTPPRGEQQSRYLMQGTSMGYATDLRTELRSEMEALQAQLRTSMSNALILKDQQEKHKAQTEAALVEVCKSLTMQQQQLEQQEQCTGMIHQLLQESLPGAATAVKRLQKEMERKQDGEQKDTDAKLKEDKRSDALAAAELLQQAQEAQQEQQQQQWQSQLWRPLTAALKASIEHVAAQQEQLQQRTHRAEQSLAQLHSTMSNLFQQVDEQRIQNVFRKDLQRAATSHRGDAAGGPRLDVLSTPTADESVLSQDVQASDEFQSRTVDSTRDAVSRSSSVASLGPLRGELAAEVAALCQERFLGLEQKLRQEMDALRIEVMASMTASLRTELGTQCEQQFQSLRGDAEAVHLEVRQQFAGIQSTCLQLLEAGGGNAPERQLFDKSTMEDMRRERHREMAELRRDIVKICEQKMGALADMGWALQREFEAMLAGASKLESLQAQRQARQMELTEAASALRQHFAEHQCVPSPTEWQRLQEKHAEVCHVVAVQQSIHACQAAELDALRRAANARFLDVAKILRHSGGEPSNIGIGLWHEFHEKQMVLLQSVFETLQRMEFGQLSELEGLREEMQVGLSKTASTLREEMEALARLDPALSLLPGDREAQGLIERINDLEALKDSHAELSSALEAHTTDMGALRERLSTKGLPDMIGQDLHIKQTELSYVVQVQQKMLGEHAEELEKLRCELRNSAAGVTSAMRQKVDALSEVVRALQQKLSVQVSSGPEMQYVAAMQQRGLEQPGSPLCPPTCQVEPTEAAKALREELGTVSDVAIELRKELDNFCNEEALKPDPGCWPIMQKKLSELSSQVKIMNNSHAMQLDPISVHTDIAVLANEFYAEANPSDGVQRSLQEPCESGTAEAAPNKDACHMLISVSEVGDDQPERAVAPGGWRELREELNAAVLALPSLSTEQKATPSSAPEKAEEVAQGALETTAQHRAYELHTEAAGLRVRLEAALQSLQEATQSGDPPDLVAARQAAEAALPSEN